MDIDIYHRLKKLTAGIKNAHIAERVNFLCQQHEFLQAENQRLTQQNSKLSSERQAIVSAIDVELKRQREAITGFATEVVSSIMAELMEGLR